MKKMLGLIFIASLFSMKGQNKILIRSGIGELQYYYGTINRAYYSRPVYAVPIEGLFQKLLSENWRLSGGVSFTQLSFHVYVGDFDNSIAFIGNPNNGKVTEVYTQVWRICFPVYGHYYFGKNKNWMVGLGWINNFANYTRTRTVFMDAASNETSNTSRVFDLAYVPYGQMEVGYLHQLKNKHELQFTLGLTMVLNPSLLKNKFYVLQPHCTIGYAFGL